jgi:hypothetical protein
MGIPIIARVLEEVKTICTDLSTCVCILRVAIVAVEPYFNIAQTVASISIYEITIITRIRAKVSSISTDLIANIYVFDVLNVGSIRDGSVGEFIPEYTVASNLVALVASFNCTNLRAAIS